MNLLTYNILDGGKERLPLIMSTIHERSPDVVCLQETNGFDTNNYEIARRFCRELSYPAFAFSPCGIVGKEYSVITFSRFPITRSIPLPEFRHAGIFTEVQTRDGRIGICNVLLSDKSDDERLIELKTTRRILSHLDCGIIIGDCNMLSNWDDYDPELPKTFNPKQLSRFTRDGKLDFRATDFLAGENYLDCARLTNRKKEWTVRTPMSTSEGHPLKARLDYAFVSRKLAPSIKSSDVIMTEETKQGSDHYPLLVRLDL